MAEGAPKAAGGGRGGLPGIPGYVDRVSAESIWRINCKSEEEYLRKRRSNPPKSREHFGALHGFEVVKHPSYFSVKRATRDASDAMSTVSAASYAPTTMDSDLAMEEPPLFYADPLPQNPGSTFTLPKYNRFSSEHMIALEMNPNGSRSAKGLRRALSVPGQRRR
mmetsp:Transcript_37957/g.85624  ORF Transcript_37957/g.85624 Transcript_37957/m.85624 type:complete len:165 (+) Transcript_37957:3-497(+)